MTNTTEKTGSNEVVINEKGTSTVENKNTNKTATNGQAVDTEVTKNIGMPYSHEVMPTNIEISTDETNKNIDEAATSGLTDNIEVTDTLEIATHDLVASSRVKYINDENAISSETCRNPGTVNSEVTTTVEITGNHRVGVSENAANSNGTTDISEITDTYELISDTDLATKNKYAKTNTSEITEAKDVTGSRAIKGALSVSNKETQRSLTGATVVTCSPPSEVTESDSSVTCTTDVVDASKANNNIPLVDSESVFSGKSHIFTLTDPIGVPNYDGTVKLCEITGKYGEILTTGFTATCGRVCDSGGNDDTLLVTGGETQIASLTDSTVKTHNTGIRSFRKTSGEGRVTCITNVRMKDAIIKGKAVNYMSILIIYLYISI